MVEVDVELGRRDDVEALEIGGRPVQEPLRAPEIGASSQRLSLARLQQKPLEGVPHVPRASTVFRRESARRGAAGTETARPPSPSRISEASQGIDACALDRQGQGLEHARQRPRPAPGARRAWARSTGRLPDRHVQDSAPAAAFDAGGPAAGAAAFPSSV